jgi:hypothetical protein
VFLGGRVYEDPETQRSRSTPISIITMRASVQRAFSFSAICASKMVSKFGLSYLHPRSSERDLIENYLTVMRTYQVLVPFRFSTVQSGR